MMTDVGQGKPLPDFMKREGAWIVEGHLFLYWSDPSQSEGGSAPRFTVGARRADGSFAYGFAADQLAAGLGVDRETLIAANRDGTLAFLGHVDVPPPHGGRSAREYVFELGEHKGSLTIEVSDDEGTA